MTSHRWVEPLARLGYAAKGVLYLLVGGLAGLAAVHAGGRTTDSRGAFRLILSQPLGIAWLALVALGLGGYAAWRVIAALTDAEGKGDSTGGRLVRLGYLGSAVVHAGLMAGAIRLAVGVPEDKRDAAKQWTARALHAPFGHWLVGAVGVGVIAYAIRQCWRAWDGTVDRRLDLGEVHASARPWIMGITRFGMVARALVFGLIGNFLIQAARTLDARRAGGIDDALRALLTRWHSHLALGVVALGLIAYGCFQLVRARYRLIPLR